MPVSANARAYLNRLSYLESNGNNAARNTSSAAGGRFQFLPSTLQDAKSRLGINPGPLMSNDINVQYPAVANYIRTINPAGYAAIEAGQFSRADSLLNGTWPSLPGGSQQQGATRMAQANSYLPGGANASQTPGGGAAAVIGPPGSQPTAAPIETVDVTIPAAGTHPAWVVKVNGDNVTDLLKDRLLTIRLVDHAGQESDSVEIVVDDRDRKAPFPPQNSTVSVAMGYRDNGLSPVEMGEYTVDECEIGAGPRTLVIRASAARLSPTLVKELRTKSWHNTTFGEIAREIAEQDGLEYVVMGGLADVKIKHEDQTNESNQAFLTRLAQKYKTTVKPLGSDGTKLVLAQRGSGALAPNITLREEEVDDWRARLKDRARYGAVKGKYLDRATNTEKVVDGSSSGEGGSGDPSYELKELHRDKKEAELAVESKLQGLTSGIVEINLRMEGRPEICAEGTLTLEGFRPEIDGEKWNVKTVTHEITKAGGFRTTVSCGSPGDDVTSWSGSGVGAGASSGPVSATGGYEQGDIGSPGQLHYHIAAADGGNYPRSSLDQYVDVGGAPLSTGITVPGGEYGADRPRGPGAHRGTDFAFTGRPTLTLKNGAVWTETVRNTKNGDEAYFRLPNGKEFLILHGTKK